MYTAVILFWAWAASRCSYSAVCWCLLFFAPMVFNTAGRMWLMLKIWIFHYYRLCFKLDPSHSPCKILEYRLDRSDVEGCICHYMPELGVRGSSTLRKMSTFTTTESSFQINLTFRLMTAKINCFDIRDGHFLQCGIRDQEELDLQLGESGEWREWWVTYKIDCKLQSHHTRIALPSQTLLHIQQHLSAISE